MDHNRLEQVYAILAAIPCGKVCTYGQVASLAGLGRGARQVGQLLRNLPDDTTLPWHRVINASGRISLPQDSQSHHWQRQRLEKEGIIFCGERVSLARYQWNPE